jgi:hypothetical protein
LIIICTLTIIAPINKNNMWIRTHSTVSKEVTKEQMWKLFSDVNNWHKWTPK